jgi:hypothetical protein
VILFGVRRPGCGMTRAALAAAHGDFRAAFKPHPLWWLAPAYLALLAARRGGHATAARLPRSAKTHRAVLAAVAVVRAHPEPSHPAWHQTSPATAAPPARMS